jgi:hypothetical protein
VTDLRAHLIDTRLAGEVATPPGESRRNCGRLVAGMPEYTFGLPDWETADVAEAEAAVVAFCGERAIGDAWDVPGYIDPDTAVAGIARHGERLAAHAAAGSRVLLATGHPTGLLGHYIELAAALAARGCQVLTPLDDRWLLTGDARSGIRYVQGVGCIWNGGNLVHSHLAVYMEALLDAAEAAGGSPDLVVGDHGMAGAAIARGVETLSIADVNDPALPLAAARGRTDGVLVIDDNLAPSIFRPVTAAMLARVT